MDSRTKWRKNNPAKARAHYRVQSAIKYGDLVPKPCEICGCEKVHAHHDDYSKPLEIRWLCVKHHKEWHNVNKPIVPELLNINLRRYNKPSENKLIEEARKLRSSGLKYREICEELGYPISTVQRWVNLAI